jgi:hypothetical protein
METPYGEPFIDEYDQMGISYLERRDGYDLCDYNEEEAISCIRCRQDFNFAYDHAVNAGLLKDATVVRGPEGVATVQAQTGKEEPRLIMGHPPITGSFRRNQYGLRGSPQQFTLLCDRPGQVVPPEGHGPVLDTGGAELPIPEGCSSPTRAYGLDGQFHPGDV